MQRKQKKVRDAFQEKFGESIYNYIGVDGKTEKLGSLICDFIHIFTNVDKNLLKQFKPLALIWLFQPSILRVATLLKMLFFRKTEDEFYHSF